MIYDAVQRVCEVFDRSFANEFAKIIAKKGIGATIPSVSPTVYRNRGAEDFAANTTLTGGEAAQLPGIGIYSTVTATQAKTQQKRDSVVTIVADYFTRGADAESVGAESMLAAEAILACIDLIHDGPQGQMEAGGLKGSVAVSLQGSSRAAGQQFYEDRCVVKFTVTERDEL